MMTKTYSELIELKSFQDRFHYLVLNGIVGNSTFGSNRYLNQNFYRSKEWRRIRNEIIIRDSGCDLGIPGREIYDKIYVHHMNPMTMLDIEDNYNILIDPEFLICTSFNTHQAITFGDKNQLMMLPKERRRGDTTPWR